MLQSHPREKPQRLKDEGQHTDKAHKFEAQWSPKEEGVAQTGQTLVVFEI